MLTEEKIRQVKKQLRSGVPQGEIKNKLVDEGYSDEEINKIFTPHTYDMRNWYLFFAILFLLIGLYLFIVRESLLFLLFAAGMFYVYYLEINRIKRSSS